MLVNCVKCDKTFNKHTGHAKTAIAKGYNIFCSKECYSIFRTITPISNCCVCNSEISRCASQSKKSKSGKIFCSRSCATKHNNKLKIGDKHPNYTGSKATYRVKAFRHYGEYCHSEICELNEALIEIPKKMLDVDHIDSNRDNDDIENLQVLCVWCHAKKTRRI